MCPRKSPVSPPSIRARIFEIKYKRISLSKIVASDFPAVAIRTCPSFQTCSILVRTSFLPRTNQFLSRKSRFDLIFGLVKSPAKFVHKSSCRPIRPSKSRQNAFKQLLSVPRRPQATYPSKPIAKRATRVLVDSVSNFAKLLTE